MDAVFPPSGSILERFPSDVLLTLIVEHVVPASVRDVVSLSGTCKSIRQFVWGTRSVWVAVAKQVGPDGNPFDPATIGNWPYSRQFSFSRPPPLPAPCAPPPREEWDALTQVERWTWFSTHVKSRLCGVCGAMAARKCYNGPFAYHMRTNGVQPVLPTNTLACTDCILDRATYAYTDEKALKRKRGLHFHGLPVSLLASFVPTFGRYTYHPNCTYMTIRKFRVRDLMAIADIVYGSQSVYSQHRSANDTNAIVKAWEARAAFEAHEYLAARRIDGETDAAVKKRMFDGLAADPSIRDREEYVKPWELHFTYGVPISLCHAAARHISKERRLRMDVDEDDGEKSEEKGAGEEVHDTLGGKRTVRKASRGGDDASNPAADEPMLAADSADGKGRRTRSARAVKEEAKAVAEVPVASASTGRRTRSKRT